MKRRTVAKVAIIGALALCLVPAGAALASSAHVSGTVYSYNTLYQGANWRYHSAGTASLYDMYYVQYCVSGSGYECNFLRVGLRNSSGTQVTRSGDVFDSAQTTGARTQYFYTPSGSSTIPAGSLAFNWRSGASDSGPFPYTWTATYNY